MNGVGIMTQISTMFEGLQISQGGRWLFCIAVCLLSVAAVSAQDTDRAGEWSTRYRSGTIVSVEAAERVLAEAKEERAAIDRRFAAEEHKCYADFFASSCVAEAKERRRVAHADVRKVEVDANAFLRQARVDERDRALAEKRAAAGEKEAERLKKEQEGRPPKTGKQQAIMEPAPAHAGPSNKRIEQHEAKLRRIEEKERAAAQKRAENVAAYEKKARDAEERQRQVEAKKKEKERERAKRGLLN
jgi:colicin import membrane protein